MKKKKMSENQIKPTKEEGVIFEKQKPSGPSTYICIGNEQDGQLEVDLVQFREKNVSMRYLSFTFSGINPKTEQLQSAFINIDNEEAFNKIKEYFLQLEWTS